MIIAVDRKPIDGIIAPAISKPQRQRVDRQHPHAHDAASEPFFGRAQQHDRQRDHADALRKPRAQQQQQCKRQVRREREPEQAQIPDDTGGEHHARGLHARAEHAQTYRPDERAARKTRHHPAQPLLVEMEEIARDVGHQAAREGKRGQVDQRRHAHRGQQLRRTPDVGDAFLEVAPR
jgi:hypothetical protein